MAVKAINPARVRELFTYDLETGVLYWANPVSSKVKAGDVAGCEKSDGVGNRYWVVKIDNVQYRRSRVVWAYVHGVDPGCEIDHWDRDSLNDRIGNLREATRVQNAINRVCPKLVYHNLPQGVRPKRKHGKFVGYIAQVERAGKRRQLGPFATPERAAEARVNALTDLHGAEWLPGEAPRTGTLF